MRDGPYYRGLLAVDIQASGRRTDPVVKKRMHQGLYEIVESSIDEAGIGWDACHVEDRGDGVFAATPADYVKDLVNPLAGRIREGLDVYNRTASKDAAMRLRVGVHADYIEFVRHGGVPAVVDESVDHVFRLVDAPAVKRLAKEGGDLTLVVSADYFDDILTRKAGREDFQPVRIDNKETRARAWVWVSPPPRADVPRQMAHAVRPEEDTSTERQIAEALPRLLDDAGPGEPEGTRGM